MRIGILQTGRVPEALRRRYGDYDAIFERFLAGHGFEFSAYPVLEGVVPESPHAADGWLITGSKFGVYEDHDWIPPLETFLRDAYAAAVPLVGICFGHQILAQALGGRVEKFQGGWSAGMESYSMRDFDAAVKLIAWHQDQVIEPPAQATVVGSSPFCRYAALAYGDRAYSIQPHPEFDACYTRDLIEARRAILPERIAENAGKGLDQAPSSKEVADHIAAFFKRARGQSG